MDLLEFYGLKEDPFKLTPDPAYFFQSVVHNEALLSMRYVIEQREGFCLVTGEPGTGKTTLLNVLMESLRGKAEIALILTPRLSPEEFLHSVIDDLSLKPAASSKNDILKAFRDFLIEKSQAGRSVIIIVDEAQNLPDDTLEELRLLSNLETDKDKLLQIILIGQPELEKRLHGNSLRQLDQRIAVRIRLRPLSGAETLEYINYRLIKAGKGFLRLDERLLKPIYRFSHGVPRVINILTSRALMSAFLEGSNIVTKKHVKYALRHLQDSDRNKMRSLQHIPAYAVSLIIIVIAGALAYHYSSELKTTELELASNKTAGVYIAEPALVALKKEQPVQPAAPAKQENVKTAMSKELPGLKTQKEEQSRKKTVRVVIPANLRSGPSRDYEQVAWVSKGLVLEVTDEAEEGTGKKWYKVKSPDGQESWISAKVVAVRTGN